MSVQWNPNWGGGNLPNREPYRVYDEGGRLIGEGRGGGIPLTGGRIPPPVSITSGYEHRGGQTREEYIRSAIEGSHLGVAPLGGGTWEDYFGKMWDSPYSPITINPPHEPFPIQRMIPRPVSPKPASNTSNVSGVSGEAIKRKLRKLQF